MLPMISSARRRSLLAEFRAVDLADQVLLERFLVGDGIEEKLAALLVVVAAAVVAAALRHVFAPLLVELGELVELFLEIVVLVGVLLGCGCSGTSSSSTGLVCNSCWTMLRSSSIGAWRMTRLCCNCGASTCCIDRFWVCCIPGAAIRAQD